MASRFQPDTLDEVLEIYAILGRLAGEPSRGGVKLPPLELTGNVSLQDLQAMVATKWISKPATYSALVEHVLLRLQSRSCKNINVPNYQRS